MRVLSIRKAANLLIFITSIEAFLTCSSTNYATNRLITIDTRLHLKATTVPSDKSNRDARHPLKTGTHTYASWRSRDEQEIAPAPETYEDESDIENLNDRSDNDYDRDTYDSEAPSPVLVWLRKLYDSMFFYGLDPAPASQKSNRQKMMRDAENYDSRKNTSPFFTPSEQRVQRYMTSMRNRDTTSRTDRNEMSQQTEVKRTSRRRSYNDPQVRRDMLDESSVPNSNRLQERERKSASPQAVISVLEEKIQDCTLELEQIDAEIATSSSEDRGYTRLLSRKSDILDDIEDLEVELVTAKSGMT